MTSRKPRKGTPLASCGVLALLAIGSFALGHLLSAPGAAPHVTQAGATAWCKPGTKKDSAKAGSGSNMTVLVTGSTGFIGSHVARYCAEVLGMQVVAIGDFSNSNEGNLPNLSNIRYVAGSIEDAAFIEGIFSRYQFDVVYHLAELAYAAYSHFIPASTYSANLVGSIRVQTGAIKSGVKHYVFLSSASVYGSAPHQPFTELSPPQPTGPFGIAKQAAERHVEWAFAKHGLPYTILRTHDVYGPLMDLSDPFRNMVALFVRKALEESPMPVFGSGHVKRQFTYVDDVAPYIAMAPLLPGLRNTVVNLGADKSHTVLQLAQAVADVAGVGLHLDAQSSPTFFQDIRVSHQKAACLFAQRKEVALKDGLAATMRWARSLPALPPWHAYQEPEFRLGLPAVWGSQQGARAQVAADASRSRRHAR